MKAKADTHSGQAPPGRSPQQPVVRRPILWGLMWHSHNKLEGTVRHLMYQHRLPLLFTTRKEAREEARLKWGYIRKRKDLQGEPHGWRVPYPVKVVVEAV